MIAIHKKLIDAAEAITGSDYETETLIKDISVISDDAIEFMVEELIHRYRELEDKFIEYDKQVNENYKRINTDPYLEYGVSEKDF